MDIRKEQLSFRNKLVPLKSDKIQYIVYHHMAHPSWNLRDIHLFHRNSYGWSGIGYNYWIDFKGNVFEGRGLHVGAHVKGYNSESIGIGFQGDFTTQKMPGAQKKAGIQLTEMLLAKFPKLSKKNIVGHRDLASTACPGKNFPIDEMKRTIQATKGTKQKSISKSNTASLVVDGKWGNETTKALQRYLNTPVDGILSGQSRNYVTEALYGSTVSYGSGGSIVIRALQKRIGATVDGLLGPETVRKLQAYLNTVVDGKLSRPSLVVKAMQRRLNEQNL